MNETCSAANVLNLFFEMNSWLKEQGFQKVLYKPIPSIYSTLPSEEDLYALFRCQAILKACGISTAIDYSQLSKWPK